MDKDYFSHFQITVTLQTKKFSRSGDATLQQVTEAVRDQDTTTSYFDDIYMF